MLLSVSRLTVVAIVALAAAMFVSCGPVDKLSRGGSVTYPAAYAVPVDAKAKEASRLDAILMGSEYIRRLARDQDTARQNRIVQPFLQGKKAWSRVPLPTDLSRTLGGAAMYLLRGDGRVRKLLCIKENTLYCLPNDLNQLLKDCGMRFTNADVHAWTPLVVYVGLACARSKVLWSGLDMEPDFAPTIDSIARGLVPLVPGMRLRKLVADTARTAEWGHSVAPGFVSTVRVDIDADGSASTVSIYTEGGGPSGDRLYPVMFVYPAWNSSIDLSVPKQSMLDEAPRRLAQRRTDGWWSVTGAAVRTGG